MLENKREERERQKREKIVAEQRLQAIEQEYRNQLATISSKNGISRKTVGQTDHKAIIVNLEK